MKDIGRELRAKREELGLTLAQVQADTKIRRRYLEALEAGDDSPIPGQVYVKGFLRFYANYLGLDGWDMVRRYREWKESGAGDVSPPAAAPERPGGPQGAPVPRFAEAPAGASAMPSRTQRAPGSRLLDGERTRAERSRRFWRLMGYAALIILLVAAGGLYYIWTTAPSPASGAEGGAPPPGTAGDDPPGAGPEDAEPDGSGPDDGQPGPGDVPGSESEPSPAGPVWALVRESERQAAYVVYKSPFSVGFEIGTQRCWVEVEVDGQVVFEQTLEPGSAAEWTAAKKVTVIFGRADSAQVRVMGQVLGMAGSTPNPRTLVFETGQAPEGPTGGEDSGQDTES